LVEAGRIISCTPKSRGRKFTEGNEENQDKRCSRKAAKVAKVFGRALVRSLDLFHD
jgi:hypothetical protein